MNITKLKVKISVFLVFMLIFWVAGSPFIYALDTESTSGTGEPTGFVSNLFKAVRSFVDNIKSVFRVNDVESAEEDGESEDNKEKEDEAEGEEDPGNKHNYEEEISNIAQGLRTGETTVEDLVEKATSIHLKVLEEVLKKVPEPAKSSIQRAMKNSTKGNTAAQDALNRKGASDNGGEDEEAEIEDEEKEDNAKSKGADNASEMGKQMRD